MLVGPAAVKHCGMLDSHAGVFQDVARVRNVVLGTRELNPLCETLLREGHASKGYHIKAKSCDWGPMAGMVLVDPRFSKNRDLRKQQAYIDSALQHGARQQPVYISSLRLMELENLGLISQRKEGGIQATEVKIQSVNERGMSAEFVAVRDGNQEPVWQLFEVTGGQRKPVLGLTNPPGVASAGPQPSGPRAVVAGDYDLFCVWGRHHNRRPLGCAPRALRGTVAKRYIDAVKRSHGPEGEEDKHMGNVSQYAVSIINQLNAGINGDTGYQGGNMVHHNDESGNPFTPGEDFPLLIFIPERSPRAVCNAHELVSLYEECEALGYAVERNPGFSLRTF